MGLSGFRTQSSPAAISASQRASLYAGKRCVCVQLTSFRPPWVYQLQFTPDNFRGQPSKQPRAKLIPFGQHDIYLNGFIWIILHNLLYISLYSSLQATLYFLFSSCLQFTKCHFVYFCCLSLSLSLVRARSCSNHSSGATSLRRSLHSLPWKTLPHLQLPFITLSTGLPPWSSGEGRGLWPGESLDSCFTSLFKLLNFLSLHFFKFEKTTTVKLNSEDCWKE